MKVAGKVEKKIKSIQEGSTFNYIQLGMKADEYIAAAKAIERLIAKEVIKRVSPGVFYKPKKTPFGELFPREEEIIKTYLFVKNKRIAYVTGIALYNRMGLTTQIPKIIKLASRNKRITVKTGSIQIKSVKSYLDVKNTNYYLLEILDVLKDFTQIPDLDKRTAINFLLNKLKELSEKDKLRILKCALHYPPRSRAFLGALLDKISPNQYTSTLKQSLNPLTVYKLSINKELLLTVSDWNII